MAKICAGIVSYNPSIEILALNINSILPQVEQVYVIDNGSENINEIKNNFSKVVDIIENNENRGIATALNQMCEIAYNNNFEWILTLDQDTICPNNIISCMDIFTDKPDIGIICPDVKYDGWPQKKESSNKDFEIVYACMTSASLTNIFAWKKVNGFEEEYFIDYVDNEFCMKLALNGYKVFRTFSCSINHQLGISGEKKIFGKIYVRFTKHNPLRFYYMSRNNYVFIKKYKRHLSVMKEYCKLIYILLKGILFADNKRETMKYIFKGICDGYNNIMGKYNAS